MLGRRGRPRVSADTPAAMLGVADQVLLSGSSILILGLVAHLLNSHAFGQFALVWTLTQIGISACRALVGETLVSRGYGENPAAAIGAAFIVAACASLLPALVSLAAPGSRSILLLAALSTPALVVQDAVRFLFLEQHKPKHMLSVDAIAVSLQVLGLILGAVAFGNLIGIIAGWSAGGVLAAVVSVWTTGNAPDLASGWKFLRATWPQSSAYFTEAIAGAAAGTFTAFMIQNMAGYAALGGYRASVSLLGITSIGMNWLRSSYLRQLRTDVQGADWSLSRTLLRLAALLAGVVAFATFALLSLPDSLGRVLFSSTWAIAKPLLIFAAINRFAASLSVVPTIVLRVKGVAWAATRFRLGVAVLSFGLAPFGAYLFGAKGALLGESLTYLLLAIGLLVIARAHSANAPQPLHK